MLVEQCGRLRELRLGTLLTEQIEAFGLALPLTSTAASALSLLPLHSLTFTVPHLSPALLLSLPSSLSILTIRFPSHRVSADTSATWRSVSIEQMEEEGEACRMVEAALEGGSGRALSEIRWEGGFKTEKVMERLEGAVQRLARDTRVVV